VKLTGDLAVRRLTAAAVLLVAAIAATVSFVHIEHLAVTHGQTALASMLLPVSIDGTVAAASLVMYRTARAGLGTPRLARVMLGLSVIATLAANVAYGARFGLTGSLLSGWPAVAFIGSAEMAIGMVRRARQAAPASPGTPAAVPVPEPGVPEPGVPAVPDVPASVPSGHGLNGHAAEAERMFSATLAAGIIPPIRLIRSRMHVGSVRAKEIQGYLEALTPAGRSIRQIRDELRQGVT
jgi:hypothetical protein